MPHHRGLPTGRRALLAAAVAGSVARAEAQETPRRGGRLVVANSGDTKTLDPHVSQLIVWQNARRQVFEQLVRSNPDGSQSPLLAASLTWTDPATLAVTLKPGVTFHNGSPFTAADVKHTFERIGTPNLPSEYAPRIRTIAGIDVAGPDRMTFRLNGPDASFLDLLADVDIISASVPADKLATTPVGTGPFRFAAWAPGESLRFVRNESYHVPGQPYLDEVVYRPMPDSEGRIASLLAGDIDVNADVPIKDIARLSQSPGVQVTKLRGGRLAMLYLNLRTPPFDNKLVRQAVLTGLDRRQYNAQFLGGLARVTNTPLDPANFAYAAEVDAAYRFDPARAKALLAQAGYGESKPLAFEMLYPVGLGDYQSFSEYMQAQMADLGVEVTLTGMELAAWSNRIIKEGRFQIAFDTRRVVETEPAIAYNDFTFTRPDARNFDGFTAETVPGFLDAIKAGLAETDRARRRDIYLKLQAMWAEALPGYIVAAQPNFLVARDKVVGFDRWGVQPFHLTETWKRA